MPFTNTTTRAYGRTSVSHVKRVRERWIDIAAVAAITAFVALRLAPVDRIQLPGFGVLRLASRSSAPR